jgi:uncharacterized protein (TIGR00369 family)
MAKTKPSHGHSPHPHLKEPQNHCFGCGKDNPEGMRLKFYTDDEARKVLCKFKLSRRYQGPPGHAHGGIIATILDEAMGKVNKFRNVLALTRKMEIEYLRPIPLDSHMTVTAQEQQVDGRSHINVGEITNDAGEVLARGTATFIAVDVQKMFAKFVSSSNSIPAPSKTHKRPRAT